jgi:hypothetical protein
MSGDAPRTRLSPGTLWFMRAQLAAATLDTVVRGGASRAKTIRAAREAHAFLLGENDKAIENMGDHRD